MKNKEITRIMTMLQNSYNGASWHGASIMEILGRISSKQALKPSVHIHRICELVQHMTTWRVFAIKRLQGDDKYEVRRSEDWQDFSNATPGTWDKVKQDLADSQQLLIDTLENTSDERLNDEVHGKAYDYYALVHGVIQHDLYHLGEISLLAMEFKE